MPSLVQETPKVSRSESEPFEMFWYFSASLSPRINNYVSIRTWGARANKEMQGAFLRADSHMGAAWWFYRGYIRHEIRAGRPMAAGETDVLC